MAKMEFGELDQYLFGQATHYDIYKKLGAHPGNTERKKAVRILRSGHRMHSLFL